MTIRYIPGEANNVADLLSRSLTVSPKCSLCSKKFKLNRIKISRSLKEQILVAGESDAFWQSLETGNSPTPEGYSQIGNLWFFQFSRLYIPMSMRPEIISKYHDLPQAGHQGEFKTIELINRNYYWPGLVTAQ
jgi:hypothetical protein